MTPGEKSTWLAVVLFCVMPVIYFAIVLPQLATTPVTDIDYQVPMFVTMGLALTITYAATIVAAVAARKAPGDARQRDKEIGRLGHSVAGGVALVLTIVPVLLTVAGADLFWVANSIYLMFAIVAVVGFGAKLFAYRRSR